MTRIYNPLLIKVVHPPYGAKPTDHSTKKPKDNTRKKKPKKQKKSYKKEEIKNVKRDKKNTWSNNPKRI